MNSRTAIVNLAGSALVACMLLLPWAAVVEAGEQARSYTETELTASDGAYFDYFGESVAISGDTAVIGAYQDDDLGVSSGSAYVFERDPLDLVWSQTAKLLVADGAAGDNFGRDVAISGGTAVIGAWLDNDLGLDSGSAYVFERDPHDPADWTQTAKLTSSDGAANDWFASPLRSRGTRW